MQLVDAVENYRSGRLHVWDEKDLELSHADFAMIAERKYGRSSDGEQSKEAE